MGQDESLVVDRSYETWNSGDVSGLKDLYAADADVVIPGASVRGREQVGALWGAFISAFPDGQLTELLRLDCGTYIVSENNLSGTHTAPLVTPQGEVQLPETMSPLTAFRSSRLRMARSSPSTFISTK
jgi:hypothetical protein